jgi:iron complex transport system ATP-binding protein
MAETVPPLIELCHASVMRGDRLVLNDLTLRIETGEHVAILGPNGCGKSTLLKTLTRECYPLAKDGSAVRIFGQEAWNVFDLRSLLGIVSNDFASSSPITGRDVVLSGFFGSIGIWPHQTVTREMEDRADSVLHQLEAAHLAHRTHGEMSSGEARRILIARALVHSPRTLVLDEPTTSLDLLAQHELRDTMRRLAQAGTGILLITHHLSDIIPEIERVILLKNGRIMADGPKEELLARGPIEKLFGIEVEMSERNGYVHAW